MPIPDIQITPVRTRRELKEFVTFPWIVYRDDPLWVPPLITDAMKLFDPARHPFHRHAEVQCFTARWGAGEGKRDQVIGRIAGIVNHAHNDFHGERTGFFGFFETIPDPRVPPLLRETAAPRRRGRGMERLRGPAQMTSNEEWGLFVDGFDRSPMVMMTYNPPTYAGYLEDFGCVKAKDLVAYWRDTATPMPERLERAAETSVAAPSVTIRRIDMKRFGEEVGRVREVYNAAWEKNWGFVPMTPEEIDHMAKELRPVVDPDFVVFAEAEGRTIGFALALPDLNRALKVANGRLWPFGLLRMLREARRIREVRVLTLGVIEAYRRRRIDALMIVHLWKAAVRRGMRGGELSWMLEDNLAIRAPMEKMGARVYKTYRLYDYPLAP